jgi:hypothetical protein
MLTIKVKMYAGYLHILGMVHDCKCIADLYSLDIKKAGPFLTPLSIPTGPLNLTLKE